VARIDPARAGSLDLQFGMRSKELLERLERIQDALMRDQAMLVQANPGWDVWEDARPRALARLAGSVARTRLGIRLLGELLDDDWWQENDPGVPIERREHFVIEYAGHLKYGFGMSCFTTVENYVRVFLRGLDPRACREATEPFGNVYQHLLGSQRLGFSGADRKDALDLLDFVCRLRNLIHNDGVCFNRSLEDEPVVYGGETYVFPHGAPVTFVTWGLLLALAEDVGRLLVQIISHPRIVELAVIVDPFTLPSRP
jgi:hypothetical protein